MKLAEALSIRKDLQKRIQQLEQRIKSNVKVQEDEDLLEDPIELMKELHSCLMQLEQLIGRINLTNINTKNAEGLSITQLMAKKDTLMMRIGILRNIYNEATSITSRYSCTEIRQECVIDVKQLCKQIVQCFNLKAVFSKDKINRIGGKDATGRQVWKFGGDPTLFLHALKVLNIEADDAIAFGNEICDAQAASKAGIKAYHCLWGAKDEERELMMNDPNHPCITSPLQIIDILESTATTKT